MAALEEAKRLGAIVIPYGGGTSVVGHLRVPEGDRPVVNISLERLAALQAFDATNLTARFGAGAPGPAIEAALAAHGMTLGHFPQSFELSTAGGWVVTRSSGQQSLRYGRIEQLFHGGRLATPQGELAVGGLPASSAGPDLREAVLGSEGRLGLLTEVTLRVRPRAAHERFHAIFFPQWDAGLARGARAGAGGRGAVDAALRERGRDRDPAGDGRGPRRRAAVARALPALARRRRGRVHAARRRHRQRARGAPRARGLADIAGAHHGVAVGTAIGKGWAKNRFRGPYLRNSLWDAGIAVETMETCVPWSGATRCSRRSKARAAPRSPPRASGCTCFTHLSHVYRQGCSVYSTFVYRLAADRRREPRALAAAQDRGLRGDRRGRRHDQPPARRRRRSRALARRRKRASSAWRSCAPRRASSIPAA